MKAPRYAWRLLRRDWRAGELQVLAVALLIAVASVASVSFFTDRIGQALVHQASALLGADVVLGASHPPAKSWGELAGRHGLRTAETVSFLSMARAGGRVLLADIKAVSPGYPLRGELRIAPARFAPDHLATTLPAPGTAWADARLVGELGVRVGEVVQVGQSRFTLAAVLSHEPDRGGALFNIAPRLMIARADLAATGLVVPGSRVQYRFLVAGEEAAVRAFRAEVGAQLEAGERLESVEDARPEMRTALSRARQFLGLAALVSVILAGVAIAVATHRFVLRRLDSCAVLRCLGAGQDQILAIYGWQLLWLGLLASGLGVVLGYLAHWALVDVLGALAATTLPPPSPWPVLAGMGVGLVTLFGSALPPLLHLRRVSPLRVLRRDLGAPPLLTRGSYVLGLLVLFALMVWQAGDMTLGMAVLVGMVATVAALALSALGLLSLLRALGRRLHGAWRLGMMNMSRRGASATVQVVAVGLGLMALLLLAVVRVELMAAWAESLPPDAHNRFLVNIQPQQVAALGDFFVARGRERPRFYPMIRGRFVALNSVTVSPESYAGEQARRLVAREFNLSWAAGLKEDNTITAGRWWTGADTGRPLVSVEAGLAKTLGLNLGDEMTFEIAGEPWSATVASLRKVEWDSMQANFFVLAPPGALDGFPATYITSFYLPLEDYDFLGRLVAAFPNVTVIDVAAIIEQVRRVIARVSTALEYVFGFTLLAGLTVLFAALQATLDQRLRETALLRTLGASRRVLQGAMVAEFAAVGALAGGLAATAAALIGAVLAEQVFKFSYQADALLWLAGLGGGALAVVLAGAVGTRGVLQRPPWQTLQRVLAP
ncbi:MAG TPA: FtsX-like permease family protein [Gammaproteobacteria bacterium]|nr:FtsX-like permease family protein [Gammaproteobacteria bacterium]